MSSRRPTIAVATATFKPSDMIPRQLLEEVESLTGLCELRVLAAHAHDIFQRAAPVVLDAQIDRPGVDDIRLDSFQICPSQFSLVVFSIAVAIAGGNSDCRLLMPGLRLCSSQRR